ncbi:NAD-dependent formate dehydrogenase alpha subunit / selenocysteine-containing [Candidatus Kuenenia stuttgartiensis]|uniref:NAD-dependent formate dehydrogenase alpha subunit / selenocysteine-containing n=1 Tax=Kuenenia stuttgartiensis TaxID=174633 RepID=A0A6G7GTU0_KUEST|nr:formate dehydrogenase subunit alpha [Candidatus Kuenenia stuttgartiensis]QII13030.1 NAD-dependent formate dehydrogenase alpha subunit / selenocysteine-containing [Candidatus Kuenenia stuttgartiensis]
MTTVIIDGKRVEADPSQTILEAARRVGIRIPTLCHDPRLKPSGACRICVVEVEGKDNLAASCATPVSEGMKVSTRSEAVLRSRRLNLELLWSNHPNDCLTCDKAGECSLQNLMYEYDVKTSRFVKQNPVPALDESNPAIYRDMNKCILCGKCVRICDEVQGQHVWAFSDRGIKTRVSTAFEKSMQDGGCVFCGHCVSVCPVGALMDKPVMKKARSWETRKVRTVCSYCGVGCSLVLHIKNNEILQVTADINSAPNYGSLCVKGRYGFEFYSSKDRLKTPLVRDNINEPFREASWEEAIGLVAKRFSEIKKKYGPDSFGCLSSSRGTNEENFLAQKFTRVVMGTNNMDNCARVCHAPSVTGLRAALGSGAATNSLADIEGAEVLIVSGSNTTEAHPVAALKIKKAVRQNGAKLIVIDPRKIELVKYADIHLQLRAGTNVALINGLLHVIIKEGLQNDDFIERRTENFEMLKQVVSKYTPEETEAITGVPKEDIIKAARMYAGTNKGMIIYGLGMTEHKAGSHGVMSLANLALITGNVGRPNTGINPLRGQNNVQGSCDMGALPDVYACYQRVDDPEANRKHAEAWKVKKLPEKPGLKEPQMYRAIESGDLKAMYIIGYDPAISQADINKVRASISKLEFLAVQELFMTETAKLAHVVLPTSCYFEKDGTFTNAERRVRRLHKAIPLPEGTKSDWDIICSIATAMGYPMSYNHPSEIMDEIAKLTPDMAGINYKRLEGDGLVWPVWDMNHPGTPILHKDTFKRGRGMFNDLMYTPSEELPDEEYPLLLTTGRRLYQYNNGSMSLRNPEICAINSEEFMEIHPADAAKLDIKSGEKVKVSSRRGSLEVKTELTEKSRLGSVFLSFHYPETPTNVLTGPGEDMLALTPEYKVCAVKVEKM